MAVTLNDIAAKVGVSHVTVSMALRNSPRVAKATRVRVQQMALEMGYTENLLARSLVTGRTMTVGILVHSLKSHFFVDFFSHLDDECFDAGYTAMFANSEFNPNRESRHLKNFLSRKVDGLVIAQEPGHLNDPLLMQMAETGMSIVTVGELPTANRVHPNISFAMGVDVRLAAEYVWRCGHRRVMYFHAGRSADSSSVIHRMRRDEFVKVWPELSGGARPRVCETTDVIYGGNDLSRQVMSLPAEERPTAIVCANDQLAISVMSALRLMHVRVPEDISVIGCDDISSAVEQSVPLTTVCLPVDELASGAWALLQRHLKRDASEDRSKAEYEVVQPRLVVRESVRTIESND